MSQDRWTTLLTTFSSSSWGLEKVFTIRASRRITRDGTGSSPIWSYCIRQGGIRRSWKSIEIVSCCTNSRKSIITRPLLEDYPLLRSRRKLCQGKFSRVNLMFESRNVLHDIHITFNAHSFREQRSSNVNRWQIFSEALSIFGSRFMKTLSYPLLWNSLERK